MDLASVKADPGVTRDAFDGSPETLALVRALSFSQSPPWRIDNLEGATGEWSIQAPLTRVPSANGVSPLALENIIQLRLFLHDGQPWGWYYPVAKPASPVLDLLNVRYLVTPDDAETKTRMSAIGKFSHVREMPGFDLYENRTALPRFFLVHDARPVSSLAAARTLIASGIDLSRTAVTDSALKLSPDSGVPGDVRTLFYEPDALELAVTAHGDSLLVAADNDYPGWRAWVDGRPAAIYRTDIAFRGVVTPDGAHRIRMEFHPDILPISLAVTAAAAGVLLALALAARRVTNHVRQLAGVLE